MPWFYCREYPDEGNIECVDKQEAIDVMLCEICETLDCMGPIEIVNYKEEN